MLSGNSYLRYWLQLISTAFKVQWCGVYLHKTYQQQKAAKCEAKDQWTRHVSILEDLLVGTAQRIQHGERLERKRERERESNTIKIRASEGLHNGGERRGFGVCVGWSLSGNRPSSLMEFAAGHGIRNTGLWTRDTGHYTTQFICSHSGHKTKPNSRFPNICSLCVLVLPLVFAPCAVAEKFEKWKLMINDIADQPAIQPATKWAGAWKLGQKLSTHLTHANVGQGQEPWNLIL